MRVAAPLDDVWGRLLAEPMLRGSLAGHTGTAVLEEADDDEHVARFRLQGDGATATVMAALRPAGEETEVDLRAEVYGDVGRDALLAAIADAVRPAVGAPHGLSTPAKRALAAAGAAAVIALALRGRR